MRRALALLLTVVSPACGRNSAPPAADPNALTPAERAALATQSPLPKLAADPTNAVADDPRAAALGQMLFFDVDLAGPLLVDSERGKAGELRKLSCHTCHAGPALDDPGKHVSIGGKPGTRNSPPVLNSAFYTWSNWGGKFDSHWALALGALEKADVMNGTRLAIIRVVITQYRAEYEALFGALDPALDPALGAALIDDKRFPAAGKPGMPAWDGMAEADRTLANRVFANAGKAIAAYMRLLVARDAPFDRWIAGEDTAISAAAKRGARLHVKHCKVCHDGPHFTDNKFHALAAAQFGAGVPAVDLGRFEDVPGYLASPFNAAGMFSDAKRDLAGLVQAPEQRGQFRTPTLRNVAVTAPYMHAGQFATLDAVMAFYNVGGGRVDGITKAAEMQRLELTPEQLTDLVAFMQTLTSTTLPAALLADTSR
ncbi:MAG TPA: cytochrome c peroxidase [Kofleriaceae bacterium]